MCRASSARDLPVEPAETRGWPLATQWNDEDLILELLVAPRGSILRAASKPGFGGLLSGLVEAARERGGDGSGEPRPARAGHDYGRGSGAHGVHVSMRWAHAHGAAWHVSLYEELL